MICLRIKQNSTCIVDKNIQSSLGLEKGFRKGAHWFQTGQIQLHVHHIFTPTLLCWNKNTVRYNITITWHHRFSIRTMFSLFAQQQQQLGRVFGSDRPEWLSRLSVLNPPRWLFRCPCYYLHVHTITKFPWSALNDWRKDCLDTFLIRK